MRLLIDNVRLWDGTGAPTQPRMAVEVRDGRDRLDRPGGRLAGPPRPGRGRGRAGAHADPRPGRLPCPLQQPRRPRLDRPLHRPPATLTLRAVELAGASLRSGVTSAREVGAPDDLNIAWARAAAAGQFPAPHLHAAGTWIAHRGTYVDFARQFSDAAELQRRHPGRGRGGRRPDQGRPGALERGPAPARRARRSPSTPTCWPWRWPRPTPPG